ncbi:MAG: hypothetical protein OEM27_05070 [Nitrospinota bacterium]|nr:hypothetical protein [Nitrospinota bacterium]
MLDFTHIRYGIAIALVAILFGGALGLSFGCCEDSIKGSLRASADAVLDKHYSGDPNKAVSTVSKSWVYFKRAHLHSQTMGVMAIVFALLATWLNFQPKFQLGISLLSGLGSLGYGVFWLLAAILAPGMGSTHAAKESVTWIAQLSGGSFFVSGVTMFSLIIWKLFIQGRKASSVPGSS